MSDGPLVSIIALNYNQSQFIEEAIKSVFEQTYSNIEVIIADDDSTDNSRSIIKNLIRDKPQIKFIENPSNMGNCKTFNCALKLAKGKYVIDFALDDVLCPEMIKSQVMAFEQLPADYGIVFGDAEYIDSNSRFVKYHYKRNQKGDRIEEVPSGDLYCEIIKRFFIAPPSVMVKRDLLLKLGGYDESLAYEDFDLWVRASRVAKFHYLDKVIVKKRILKNSLSSKFYQKQNKLVESTLRICEKIQWLNSSVEEQAALIQRIRYEMRHAYFVAHFSVVRKYFKMLRELKGKQLSSKVIFVLSCMKMDVHLFYKLYFSFKYR